MILTDDKFERKREILHIEESQSRIRRKSGIQVWHSYSYRYHSSLQSIENKTDIV